MHYGKEITALDAEVQEASSTLDTVFRRCLDGVSRAIRRCSVAMGAWVLCLGGSMLVFGTTTLWLLIPMGVLAVLLVAFMRKQFRQVSTLVEEYFAAEQPYSDVLTRRNKLHKSIDEQPRSISE